MIICFAGHSIVREKKRVEEIVKVQIKKHILNDGGATCYLGGHGDFDEMCARVCRELKREHAAVELVYVAPYMNLSEQLKIREMQDCGLCDTSIYPPIENTPPKFAISMRNEWMMSVADLVIAFVEHNYGGAYKSLRVAERRKKKIINIIDFL